MAELVGYILTLYTTFTWAAASLVYKRGLKNTQPKANLFFRLFCVFLGTFIFAIILGNINNFKILSNKEIIDYIFVCVISGLSVTIGDLLYYMSLKKIDASRAYPLTQLSLIFVIFFSIIFFNEAVRISTLIGGALIISCVFILSSKDKSEVNNLNEKKLKKSIRERMSENLVMGVFLAIGVAFFWGLSYVSFNQARIISGDVFYANFIRVTFAIIAIAILGLFQKDYYSGFKKDNRTYLKYYIYIGIAGIASLGLADALFCKAAEINGLILTSTITANTPMVQQILSILILKEKFRKRFLLAVILIIVGNYTILFV